jgi:hypothetical protein
VTEVWARHRGTLVIVLTSLAALAVVLLLGTGARTGARLDPDNPGSAGGRAVARVLADQGVDVEVVRSAADLEAATVDGSTTVLVTSSDSLGRSTADRLLDHAAGARVVVAEPGPGVTDALGVSEQPSQVPLDQARSGSCTDDTLAGLDDVAVVADRGLEYPTSTGCFPGDGGWLVASPGDGIVLLGVGGILENDQVLRADNAAAALRLLGQEQRLVWYVPDVADLVADDGVTLRSLLPPWLLPGLWLGALAMVAVIWWRARRLGALATEPLPVVVKAIETTQARGRLYRAAGDRGHAASVLRRAAREDAARHLRLPGAPPDVVVREVARIASHPLDRVDALLGEHAPAPRTDAELIRLATDLAELDREVRRT